MRCSHRATTALFACVCASVLAACNPVFNWREVRSQDSELVALFPCKPDSANRPVILAGQSLDLEMMGCDAGGATFAVAHATLTEPSRVNEVLTQWRAVTLANIGSVAPSDVAFVPKGALAIPASVQTLASGRRADGNPVVANAAWFARGAEVFHVVIYADKLSPQVSETFFTGLTFQ